MEVASRQRKYLFIKKKITFDIYEVGTPPPILVHI